MVNQEFVKNIASDVTKELFEGGPGSGNWGHKGRPGHRGGSLPKGSGGGKGGIAAHVVKAGVHASTFYDKSGGLKISEYKKLTSNQKTTVLKHGVQSYKEKYIPKAQQGGLDAKGIAANKKVGALEGMRRAALNKVKEAERNAKVSLGGLRDRWMKEQRAAMHVAISLQTRAAQVANSMRQGTAKIAVASSAAAKTAERQPGK